MPRVAFEKFAALNAALAAIDARIAAVRRENRADGMGKSVFAQEEMRALYAERNALLSDVRSVAARYGIAMA